MNRFLNALRCCVLAAVFVSVQAFAGADLTPYISGDVLTIPAGTVVLIDDDNASQFSTVNSVVFAAATSVIDFQTTTQLALPQTFSGSGRFGVTNGGKVRITGDNSAFTGQMGITNANVVVASRHALGTASVSTYNGNGDSYQLEFEGDQTTDAKINSYGNAAFQRDGTTTVTFNAEFEDNKDMDYPSKSFGNANFYGGYKKAGRQTHVVPKLASNVIRFSKVSTASNIALEPGIYYFMTDKTQFGGGTRCDVKPNAKIICEAKDCLMFVSSSSGGLSFQNDGGTRYLDLNGYDQLIKACGSNTSTGITDGGTRREVIKSATPATMQLNAMFNGSSYNYIDTWTYPFLFRGAVNFKCNIREGDHLSICNAISDSTGSLEVSRGTLEFKWKAGWGGTNVVISGGTLICNSPNTITNENCALTITSGKIQLVVDVHVKSATIAGTTLATGKAYAKADLPSELQEYVDGDGKLYVDYNPKPIVYGEFVWTGSGSDNLLTTAANWKGGVAPDFTECGATLIFGDDTECKNFTATAAGTNMVNRIVFAGIKPFTLNGKDDAATILLGSETDEDKTIVASNKQQVATSIPTNVLNVAIKTSSAYKEIWSVGAYTALDIRGKCYGNGAEAVELRPLCLTNKSESYGTILLTGDNSGLICPFQLYGGKFRIGHENALGSSTRTVVASGGDGVRIKFDCLTNNVPFNANTAGLFNNLESITDRPEGLVFNAKFTGGTGMNFNMSGLTFRGGIQCDNCFAQGSARVENVGVSFGGVLAFHQRADTITLAATGNNWNCWTFGSGAKLICDVMNALAGDRCLNFGEQKTSSQGTLDLNGYNQTCAGFCKYMYSGDPTFTKGATACGTVKSDTPAMVTWSGTPKQIKDASAAFKVCSPTNEVKFTGHTSLKVAADADVTHTIVNIKSDTDGSLEVVSGKLVFAWGAGWTQVTNVTLSGSGKMQVDADSATCAFGPAEGKSSAVMSISDSATLQIDGGQLSVYALSVNGEYKEAGVYGSAESGVDPAYQLSCLKGKGTVKSRRSSPSKGFLIITR